MDYVPVDWKGITLDIIKPDSLIKKIIFLLFLISSILTFYLGQNLTTFLIWIVTGIIVLRTLVTYKMRNFFKEQNDQFAQLFSRGYDLIFISGVLGLLRGVYQNAVSAYYNYQMRTNGYSESLMSTWESNICFSSFALVIISIIGLYGSYLLIKSLQYYKQK